MHVEGGNMNQEELRKKLIYVTDNGLVAKAISQKAQIPPDVLSRFKNGKVLLCEPDAIRLEKYLSLVQLPTEI
mgnify:CR=1 FL=1